MYFPNAVPIPADRTKRYLELLPDAIGDDEYVIIPRAATEQRAKLSLWEVVKKDSTKNYILVEVKSKDSISISVNGAAYQNIVLTDKVQLQAVLAGKKILLDISGIPYHVWAPLLKSVYELKCPTRVLYAEPESYKPHENPASSSLFDLSVTFDGLSPLPGFAQLSGPEDEDKCIFVALLGFEGNRPMSLIYQIDPAPKVIPVIGVPGFQTDFPTFTATCNEGLLREFQAYSDIRYARASCPFEIIDLLGDIRRDYPEHYMYIAPVGTKPHGLGAILYSIVNSSNTELYFDHPIRKDGRTKGVGVIHIYDFGNFDDY